MKSHHILLFSLLLTVCLSYINTTNFWATQLNRTSLGFQSYSGYQDIDWYYGRNNGKMFYSLFGAYGHDVMTPSDTVPLIIWLNGGPGSNSQFGAFTEVGPIRIQKGVPKIFDYSWNIFGNILFIDSPLDVGFSHEYENRLVGSTNQATNHLLNFLTNFFKEFSSLSKCPLYLTGQSYAGHYIPNLARKILTNSTFAKATGVKLAGISIGDGWVDPINQVNYVDSFLWSAGIIDNKFRDVVTWHQTQTMVNVFQGKYANGTDIFTALFRDQTVMRDRLANINIYNFREYVGGDTSYAAFLEKNKKELGVPDSIVFIDMNQQVYTKFRDDNLRSFAQDLVTCLRSVKVLIYQGQNDISVTTAGVLSYLNALQWQGISSWKQTRKQIWTRFGQVKGWVKSSGNLWFAMVNGAGHMVPTDQPQATFIMFGHFLFNQQDWHQ